MKQWKKITAIISLAVIILIVLFTWGSAYLDMKYMIEPLAMEENSETPWKMIGLFYSILQYLSFALFISLLSTIILTVCLCRKGEKEAKKI